MPPSCQRRRCLTPSRCHQSLPLPYPPSMPHFPLVPARFRAAQTSRNTSSDAPVARLPAPHPPPPIPLLRSALLSDLLPLEVQPHLLLLLRVRVRVRAKARASARARVRARARARVSYSRVRVQVRVRVRVRAGSSSPPPSRQPAHSS